MAGRGSLAKMRNLAQVIIAKCRMPSIVDARPESLLAPGERLEVTAEANTVLATVPVYGGGVATFRRKDGNIVLLTDRRLVLAEVGLPDYDLRGSVAFPRSEIRVLSYERTLMLREIQLGVPDREEPVRLRFADPFCDEARVLADRLGWEAPATRGLRVLDPLVGTGAFLGLLAVFVIVLAVLLVGPSPALGAVSLVLMVIVAVAGAVTFGRLL